MNVEKTLKKQKEYSEFHPLSAREEFVGFEVNQRELSLGIEIIGKYPRKATC
ncbi:hypothetical protein AB1L07_05585 [Niallia alba]|uniref:hypothetical protein n=1 Tax=Niallia alba TaxID=2729105 RepID=UPI00399D46D5